MVLPKANHPQGTSHYFMSEQSHCNGLAQAFERAGARVVTTRSLREALQLVESDSLAAAVLDHALGDGDSSQLCARLKERDIPSCSTADKRNQGACHDAPFVAKPSKPEGAREHGGGSADSPIKSNLSGHRRRRPARLFSQSKLRMLFAFVASAPTVLGLTQNFLRPRHIRSVPAAIITIQRVHNDQ